MLSPRKVWQVYESQKSELLCPFRPDTDQQFMYFWARQVPKILRNMLGETVTAELVIEARNRVLDAFLAAGLERFPISSRDVLKVFIPPGTVRFSEVDIAETKSRIDRILRKSPYGWRGSDDEEFLRSESIGLNEKAMALYRKNKLTFEKLLQVQPSAILPGPWCEVLSYLPKRGNLPKPI